MKKFFITITVILFCASYSYAQNVGYINTEVILNEIPEYQKAQQQLDNLADKYKSAIEAEIGKIDVLYKNYQAQKASYTPAQQQAKENEIISKEKSVKEKQKIYFGEEGIMAKKSEELLGPIKDRVQDAIDQVGARGRYTLIIDLSVAAGVVYKDNRNDLTQQVIDLLNK